MLVRRNTAAGTFAKINCFEPGCQAWEARIIATRSQPYKNRDSLFEYKFFIFIFMKSCYRYVIKIR